MKIEVDFSSLGNPIVFACMSCLLFPSLLKCFQHFSIHWGCYKYMTASKTDVLDPVMFKATAVVGNP